MADGEDVVKVAEKNTCCCWASASPVKEAGVHIGVVTAELPTVNLGDDVSLEGCVLAAMLSRLLLPACILFVSLYQWCK